MKLKRVGQNESRSLRANAKGQSRVPDDLDGMGLG